MKKQRTSLFRILILSLVMLVTVFIFAIAWFSTIQDATANGLSVKSTAGSGLEATFTPKDESSWKFEIADDTPKAYPLVTGSGLFSDDKIDLFLPTVNRSTGEVETVTNAESQKVWGVSRTAEAGKDFFETDVYFRSTEKLDVAITTESSVTPRSLIKGSDGKPLYDSNLSEFGNFSRDYIAGASRIGVYNADDQLQFVWAPNKNYELKAGSEFVEIKKNSAAGGGMLNINSNPEVTFGIYNYPRSSSNGKNYYMWEAKTQNSNFPIVSTDPRRANPQGITMRYDYKNNIYMAALDVSSTPLVDHAVYPIRLDVNNVDKPYNDGSNFSKSGQPPNLPPINTDYPDAGADLYNERLEQDFVLNGKTYKVQVYFQGARNIQYEPNDPSAKWAQMSILASAQDDTNGIEFFKAIDRFQVLLTFDPTANDGKGKLSVKKFAFYSSSEPGSGWGTIDSGGVGTSAFALQADQQVVFASPNNDPAHQSTFALNASSTGLSVNEVLLNATTVTEKDSDGNTSTRDTYKINQQSLLPGSVFTVEKTGSVGQYKFKHNATGWYLYDNNGTLALTASANATPFELTNGSDYKVTVTNGEGGTEQKTLTFCRLQSKGSSKYYLSINESGAFLSTQKVDCRIFISQGGASSSAYTFSEERETDEKYKYLKKNTSSIIELTELKEDVDVFRNPGTTIVTDLSNIDTIPIITLTKENDTDQYYTGKIKIRIWVEGTDDEAKTPLVNGVFYTQLVFNGTRVSA